MRYIYMKEYATVFFHHDPKQERPYIVDNALSVFYLAKRMAMIDLSFDYHSWITIN